MNRVREMSILASNVEAMTCKQQVRKELLAKLTFETKFEKAANMVTTMIMHIQYSTVEVLC